MIISLIAAVAENGVIGKNNQLPWRLPADMKYFRQITLGHCVIMGRKNYDSIPLKFRPLEGRTNIIITRQKKTIAPGCIVVHSLKEAIRTARKKTSGKDEVFVIGGGQIYTLALPLANKMYITHIHHSFDGDTFFPGINWQEWKPVSKTVHQPDEKNKFAFSFCVYEKILHSQA